MGTLRAMLIGTSGWQYRHWRGGLYPESLAVPRWLGHYAERFATVEVNNAFYRLPELATFKTWSEAVGDDFVFAVKASRYLTHVRRLRDPDEPVRRFLERARGLGPKLGPVLVQLPPSLSVDLGALDRALGCFPRGVRVAVEFRHDSWWTPGARSLLERHGAALCLADQAGQRSPLWRTADWGYLRLHGGRRSRRPAMGEPRCRHGPTNWPSCGPHRPTCTSISTTTSMAAPLTTPGGWPRRRDAPA